MNGSLSFDDLLAMDGAGLHQIMLSGFPLDLEALANTRYQGVDLSMPAWAQKILWQTFRKTFYRDDARGVLRGWNVRVEQRGLDAVTVPLRDRAGDIVTFGHYVVTPNEIAFPGRYRGAYYLDYGAPAGNLPGDPARFTYSPLVAVNEGDMSLLLGWEVFRLGRAVLPVPLYWALRLEGDLPATEVASVPRP